MASIIQRNKSYAVIYYNKSEGNKSKQKWETYSTKGAAEKRKWEIENATAFLGIAPKLSSLSELLDEYIRVYGEVRWSYTSHSSRVSLIKRYIIPQIGKVQLSKIDGRFISRYFHKLYNAQIVDNKYNPASSDVITGNTVHDIYKLLRSVFNQAVIWGIYSESPMKNVRVQKPFSRPRNILSIEQVKEVVRVATEENTSLSIAIQLAFLGSLRKGEILALCWNDFDFEEGCVHITKELIRIADRSLSAIVAQKPLYIFPTYKVNSKTHLVLKTPKTLTALRKVFLPKTLMENLLDYKENQKQKNGKIPYQLIFSNERGQPLETGWVNKQFDALLNQCELPKVVFHSLRHSSTTYKLLVSGGDIKSVQGDNGHASADMVLNVYARIQDEQRKDMANQMENVFYN